jgi:hypothetical protein
LAKVWISGEMIGDRAATAKLVMNTSGIDTVGAARIAGRLKNVSVYFFFCCAFSIFAHVSRSVTARLKTNAPGLESTGSALKYPNRSN